MLIKYRYFALYGSFAYRYILSISGWLLIKFNNAFVFLDPEPLNYYCSLWMIWNIWLLWIRFFSVFICNIIKTNHFILSAVFSNSILHTFPTLAPYIHDVILSKVHNLLSSLLLSTILLISSVYTLFALRCRNLRMIPLFSNQHL